MFFHVLLNFIKEHTYLDYILIALRIEHLFYSIVLAIQSVKFDSNENMGMTLEEGVLFIFNYVTYFAQTLFTGNRRGCISPCFNP